MKSPSWLLCSDVVCSFHMLQGLSLVVEQPDVRNNVIQTEHLRLQQLNWWRALFSATSKHGIGQWNFCSTCTPLCVHCSFPILLWFSLAKLSSTGKDSETFYRFRTQNISTCFKLIVAPSLVFIVKYFFLDRLIYLRVTGMDDGLDIKERILFVSCILLLHGFLALTYILKVLIQIGKS